jgi:hypothetical protein
MLASPLAETEATKPSAQPSPAGDAMVDDWQEVHLLPDLTRTLEDQWTLVAQESLPEAWKWDVEYDNGCWTCTPLHTDVAVQYPLTIGGAPLILPVEYRWPLIGGVNPPPDPRPLTPIDCRKAISLDIVRDLFITFEGSIGFYFLINSLLQVIVKEDFDTTWASSHLPQRYGGLKVCYIIRDQEPTMLSSATKTAKKSPGDPSPSAFSRVFKRPVSTVASSNSTLKLNDCIEARSPSKHKKERKDGDENDERYGGKIGIKVTRQGDPFLIMSTHVITEALLANSPWSMFTSRGKDPFEKIRGAWNEHVEIWAGNEKIGRIDQSFDAKVDLAHYPKGFQHDITLVSPLVPSSVKDIKSPISDMGWLNREAWNGLRQDTSAVKFLSETDDQRKAKTLKCRGPSEIAIVGEGIFLNKTAVPGGGKSLQDHDISTWENLVSRAILYRVSPDFKSPNGQSGMALYAEGMRSDGKEGPGIVGFQSFVQRSSRGNIQNFALEGQPLQQRLKVGLVSFYGAFQVPEDLQRDYVVV